MNFMIRLDSDKFLLFIEPKKEQKSDPVNDSLTGVMEYAFSKATKGVSNYSRTDEPPSFRPGSGWMGRHITECGEISSNNDYLLENGMITNSLCVFYLRYYRDAVPDSELNKVRKLKKYYTK